MTRAERNTHARHLLTHAVGPLIQAVRMMPADDAIALWRALDQADRETVVLLLAAVAPADRDPERELSWLTGPVIPEHSDLSVEAPRPLVPVWVGAS